MTALAFSNRAVSITVMIVFTLGIIVASFFRQVPEQIIAPGPHYYYYYTDPTGEASFEFVPPAKPGPYSNGVEV